MLAFPTPQRDNNVSHHMIVSRQASQARPTDCRLASLKVRPIAVTGNASLYENQNVTRRIGVCRPD